MSFDAGAIEARMQLSLNEWKASVEAVKKDQGNMAKAADEHSGALKGLWQQFAIGQIAVNLINKAYGIVKDTIKDSIKEAADYELAVKGLNSAFEITGRNMPGMVNRLKDYANELQKLGLADDAVILKAESLLLQLTNLDEKGIKAATRGAIGLSSVFGIDLTNAAEMVAKGMEGNYTMLGRLIPAVRNATTEGEKQAAMLKTFEDLYKRAIADTETYAGQVKKLGIEWGETKKNLGEAILSTGILQSAMEGLADIVKGISGETARQHKKATQDQNLANYEAYESLVKMADQLGWSHVKLALLTQQYHISYPTLVEWIQGNMFGKDAAAALAKATEDQVKKLADQKKGFSETGTAVADHTTKIIDLKKELNLTFTSDLKKKVEDIGAALKKYGDELPESEVQRLKAEQRKLNDELTTGGLVLGMVEQRLKLLKNPIEVITAHMEALGKVGAAAFGRMGAESWVTVKEVESGWNDLYNNLTQGWASTLQSWFEGTLTFSDFLKETWGDIKEAFFTVIAQMVAEWTIKFIKRLITDAAGLFKDIGEFFSKLFKGVSEGAEEAGKSIAKNIGENLKDIGGGAASMAGSFLQAASSIAGIVTAISTILLLLKGTDKQTDVTYWLKRIDDKTQEIHDCLLVDYKGYFNDFWNFFYAIERHTNDVIDAVYSVKNAINDISSLQTGGYVPETGLAMLHAGEYVVPPVANQGFVNAAMPPTAMSGAVPVVNNYLTINAIDTLGLERWAKGPGIDIMKEGFRQNKKGMTTEVNKWLKAMA